MSTLDNATQPLDLSGWVTKPGATVRPSAPLPGPPQRVSPVAPGISTIANTRIAASQNQAEYAVKRLLTKPQASMPSGTSVITNSSVIINNNVPWATFQDPNALNWSWVNQGPASATSRPAVIVLSTDNTGSGLHLYLTPLNSAPYTITAAFQSILPAVSSCASGLSLYDSVSTQVLNSFLFFNELFSPAVGTAVNRFSDPTSYDSDVTALRYISNNSLSWLRIQDDGTTRTYSFSLNGIDWITQASTANTDWFTTATHCGLMIDLDSGTASSALTSFQSFEITYP